MYFLCESFRYFCFTHTISILSLLLTLASRQKGDSLRFIFFLFATKQAGTAFSHESFLYFCFCYIKIMNPFFLSVSFPRTRREVPSLRGDRGMLAYTGQNYFGVLPILIISILMCLLTLAPSDGLRFVIFPLFPVMKGQFFVCFL